VRASGEVILDGTNLLALSRRGLRPVRAQRVAMIFQDPRAHIDPLWTSGDYLVEGLTVNKGLSRSAARRRALELLDEVGISDPERVAQAYPSQLSGGMLQRVMIAGALAADPELVVADEPTTALDVTIQAEIVALLDDLRRERRLGTLFITHDLELASAICDRVLVMYAGRVVEEQPTRALFEAPLHPYTTGLLSARPRVDGRRDRLDVIPGRPPSIAERPQGCPFHPRCPFAQTRCIEGRPPLRRLDPRAATACIRAEEIGDALREAAAHVA
jgi:oligopeptide/dipeptide ABC transporter ATP-binding protein